MPHKKYCPGLIHLRAQLRKLIAAENATFIKVHDGEEDSVFGTSETLIVQASELAADVDGIVTFIVGRAVLQVIYDGPYTEANAAEIINDTNERAEEILS